MINKKEQAIKKYLATPCDMDLVYTLHLYLSNDYCYYKTAFLPCVNYAKKRVAKGDFNKILFLQNLVCTINVFLRTAHCKKTYYDLPERIPLPVRFKVAEILANHICYDFLGI